MICIHCGWDVERNDEGVLVTRSPGAPDLPTCGTTEQRHEVEELDCLNAGPDCKGTVEYRMPLSGTGKSFPRCDKHWDDRLDQEQGLRERYPEQPPSDWSPLDAGESWDEEY